MKLLRKAGVTSEIWQVFIQDSSSTTGAGLTGLAFNTASLTAYYHRDTDTTATAITLATMTVGTFTSSGFKEIDATNMPGWYQFCPPNAALAASAKSCGFHLRGATNMAPLPIECQLIAVDVDDAARLGLAALPNAVAGANGGLPLSVDASGRVDVLKVNGTSQTAKDLGALNVTNLNTLAGHDPGETIMGATDLDATLATIAGYIDTEVAAILTKVNLIPGTQDGKTFAQVITLMASVLLGKASGLGTTTAVFRAVDDSKDRVTATVDASGNRSAVTLDAS